MSSCPTDRRQVYDLDYFADGGVERRSGNWDKSDRHSKLEAGASVGVKDRSARKWRGGERRKTRNNRKVDQSSPVAILTSLDLPYPPDRENNLVREGRSNVKLHIEPESYPLIKLNYNKQREHENRLVEIEVKSKRKLWLDLANTCKTISKDMNDPSHREAKEGLTQMFKRIMSEIEAEDSRLANKKAYESLADIVFEINSRTDLDMVRKGQMIHDIASRLQLET